MQRILVIDDDSRILENATGLLLMAEYEVITATNGKMGFEKVMKFHPDIIICDIMMPETNGVGFLNMIYKELLIKDVPLIFMSAGAIPEYVHRNLIKAGYEFLSKPFTENQLLNAVEKGLRKNSVSKPNP